MRINTSQVSIAKFTWRLPLRWVLVIPFVVQLVAAVGLVGWLSWRNGRAAVNDVAAQLRREITARVEKQVDSVLETHKLINRLNVDAVREGYLDLDLPVNSPILKRYCWRQILHFPTASYIYYAGNNHDFFGCQRTFYDRQIQQKIGYTYAGKLTEYQAYEHMVDEEGNLDRLVKIYSDFIPKDTFWYQQAVKVKKPGWTRIYGWHLGQNISLDTVSPLYDNQGKIKGVLGVSFTLDYISDFLKKLDVGEAGQTFILEKTGHIVATSTTEIPYAFFKKSESHQNIAPEDMAPLEDEKGDFYFVRVKGTRSKNYLTRSASEFLNNKFTNLANISESSQLEFNFQGEKHFMQVSPFQDEPGIDWLIVVVIPEAEFMDRITAQTRTTIFLCIGASICATVTSIFTARWVTKPMLKLNLAAKDIARGQWEKPGEINRTDEVGELANSFNQMAVQLQESFQNLEQRVADRTAELQEQRRFLRQVIDSNPNMIFVKDEQGRFVLANQALAEVYGTTVEELIGKTDADFNPNPTEVKHYWEIIQEVITTGCTQIREETLTTAKGDLRYLQVINIRMATETPKVLGVAVDLTDRKQFEAELQQAKEAADAANQAKSEFLANMSHELRTPLNGILGYAQILQRASDLNPKHRHGIDIIQQAGSHLLALINDILDLAKIEARKMELDSKDFHFPAFLNGVAEIIRIRAENQGIDFYYLPDSSLPTVVVADEKRLRQVLINLLGNAIKFTHQGSVTFQIELLHQLADQAKLRFQINDTGVGIAPEQISRIFLPFEQVGAAAQQVEGTGLGLTICNELLRLMGSEIHVSSKLGEGSSFWFELELAISDEWVNRATTGDLGQIVGYNGPRRKLLLVDDKEVNRLVAKAVLETLGFVVAEAENGAAALAMLESFQPDLIITDIVMPVMNGYEFTQQVRQSYSQEVTIIASSASVSLSDQSLALAVGCNDFLPKPLDLDQLLLKLPKYMNFQWVYEPAATPQVMTPSTPPKVVFPPGAELVKLQRAALIGDIETVEQEAERLQGLAPEYLGFVQMVLALAREFDADGIRELIAQAGENG